MINEASLSVEEKIASLFQQDTLLPAQFFDTFRRKSHLDPEKRLMLAVLEDAITCFQHNARARNNRSRRLFEQAERWFMQDFLPTDVEAPRLSFEYICSVLGFDPVWLREGLQRWYAAHRAEPPEHGPHQG